MQSSFESIPAPESPLSRRDPRWKLAAFIVAVLVAGCLQTVPAATAAWVGALLLAVIGRVPVRWYLAWLSNLLPFFALFVVLTPFLVRDSAEPPAWLGPLGTLAVSPRGLYLAALIGLKSLAIVTLVLVLLTAAPFHVTLQAARSLRIPSLFVQLTLLTYRYLFLLMQEFARLRTALRVRGFRNRATLHSYRTVARVGGSLLVRSHERAERVGQAMRCRGFDGRFRSLIEFHTGAADVVLFASMTAMALGIAAWDVLERFQ
jgi:cobalt/nickel transport system permease protein